MKLNRKYKGSTTSDTFTMSITLGSQDVRNVLIAFGYMDDALSESFWADILGTNLSKFGMDKRPLSVAGEMGKWSFSLAVRKGYLRPDSVEENLYLLDLKKLKQGQRGVTSARYSDDGDK